MLALPTLTKDRLFFFTQICLLAYIAVLNPRHSTFVSELFFICSAAGMGLGCV
jgi:hypothetical protein